MKDVYNKPDPLTATPVSYWHTNGSKFTGTDDEFKERYTGCGHQMPWADEESYFDTFLCCKDFKECDKQCGKHHPLLNPDIVQFVIGLNERLNNGKE